MMTGKPTFYMVVWGESPARALYETEEMALHAAAQFTPKLNVWRVRIEKEEQIQ